MFRSLTAALAACAICLPSSAIAQKKPTREEQVRKDRQAFLQNDDWFYNDMDAALKEAERSKRPLMVVFR